MSRVKVCEFSSRYPRTYPQLTNRRYRVEIQYPPEAIRPNGRANRWARARAIASYRRDCGWSARETLSSKPPPLIKAAAISIYVPATRRRMDTDNLIASLKAAFDGFQDAGLLADDRALDFTIRYTDQVHKHRLVLYVTEISTPPTAASLSPNA